MSACARAPGARGGLEGNRAAGRGGYDRGRATRAHIPGPLAPGGRVDRRASHKERNATPFAYQELEHERLIRLFEETGRVDIVLSPKRAYILNAFLRNDRRLRGYETLNPSGWQVLASFSTAAFLTARIYLFHRRLYEIFPLVAIHDPVVEMSRSGESGWHISFSRSDTDAPLERDMGA